MISATVMTAQTTINIVNGDMRHLGSGKPARGLDGHTAIAHQHGGPHAHIISTLRWAVANFYRRGTILWNSTTKAIHRRWSYGGCNPGQIWASNRRWHVPATAKRAGSSDWARS